MTDERPQLKLLLAPLKGFTDAVFRKTYFEHFTGFDGAVAPFVTAAPADRINDHHVRDLLPRPSGGMPVVPQILGNTAEHFIFLGCYLFDTPTACITMSASLFRNGAWLSPGPTAPEKMVPSRLLPTWTKSGANSSAAWPKRSCRENPKTQRFHPHKDHEPQLS